MPKMPSLPSINGTLVALLLGIVAGYYIGYKDAYRGEKAIGARIGIALGKLRGVTPEGMTEERQRRAQMMRDSIRSKSGLNGIDSAVAGSRVP
jgi:hypothetical protein